MLRGDLVDSLRPSLLELINRLGVALAVAWPRSLAAVAHGVQQTVDARDASQQAGLGGQHPLKILAHINSATRSIKSSILILSSSRGPIQSIARKVHTRCLRALKGIDLHFALDSMATFWGEKVTSTWGCLAPQLCKN